MIIYIYIYIYMMRMNKYINIISTSNYIYIYKQFFFENYLIPSAFNQRILGSSSHLPSYPRENPWTTRDADVLRGSALRFVAMISATIRSFKVNHRIYKMARYSNLVVSCGFSHSFFGRTYPQISGYPPKK